MKLVPLQDMCKSPPRKFTLHHAGLQVRRHFILSVLGMKMRRRMIVVIHSDYDSQKY